MRENCTSSLSGGRGQARRHLSAPPPTRHCQVHIRQKIAATSSHCVSPPMRKPVACMCLPLAPAAKPRGISAKPRRRFAQARLILAMAAAKSFTFRRQWLSYQVQTLTPFCPPGFLLERSHRLTILQAVAGWRLEAIRTVQSEPALEFGDPRRWSRDPGSLGRDRRD